MACTKASIDVPTIVTEAGRAITAHQSTGSDANPVILNYNALSDTSKQDLIYYLRSL